MITAKWKEGFERIHKGADAQKVASEIISIGKDATPQQIVERARDEKSELHKCFTWNDSIAAEKFRIFEARQIVCHLVIREQEVPQNRPEVRYFYKPSRDSGYKPTKVIVQKEDEYKALLEQAWAELQAFKRKYSCLTELQEIFDLIK